MLLKEVSFTAVVIGFLHFIQSPFLLLTSSVKQPPQNRWLHGWILTGTCMISKQNAHVISSFMDCANACIFDFWAYNYFLVYYYLFSLSSSSFFFFSFYSSSYFMLTLDFDLDFLILAANCSSSYYYFFASVS